MKCSCGSKAIYFKRNEGRYYCKKCFCQQLEKKFIKTCNKNKLIKHRDKIAVAISGGKDSSVILFLLKNFFKNEIFAITIDEGIMGYRNKGIVAAERLCKQLKVNHFVFGMGIELDKLDKKNYCTYCGVLRRYALNKNSRELGATKLAVGHNLDDEAQSIMMNFIRGDFSRFQRLGALPAVSKNKGFVPRIKPMVEIPEKEIVLYALIKKIPYYGGECPYSLDNQRRIVQEFINNTEDRYPGSKNQIASFYERIRPFISKAHGEIIHCEKCGEPSSGKECKACELRAHIKGNLDS